MEKTVLNTIKCLKLLFPGDHVLVAVSGGADSLCLLHFLHSQAKTLGIKLHVAHINHGLRPEAPAEELFVKKWALRLGLPVTVCRVDVEACRRAGGYSKQDAARRVRYASLRRVAWRMGANRLAVAHHLDDRVETMLLRLVSGSGLDGLAGIPATREMTDGLTLIRPLYNIRRAQIEQYCLKNKLVPVIDASNLSTRYLRNHVRLRLLPFLEAEFGGHLRRVLAKTSELLALDSALIKGLIEQAFKDNVICDDNGCVFGLADLHRLPAALQARLLRRVMWAAGVERPSEVHVQNVLGLALAKSPSAQISLPAGIVAERSYEKLRIGRQRAAMIIPEEKIILNVPGSTFLPWGRQVIETEIIDAADLKLPLGNRMEACLDLALLEAPLYARTRRPGDRVRLLGAAGSRKVKDVLIDKKIPVLDREIIPIVFSNEQIAWIGGVETAHSFRITPATKQALYLKLNTNTE